MGILRVVLIMVEVVCSLLLIGVILLQKSKSEGLGLAFGSGMGESLFGSRAGNVLTKITVTLAMVFLATPAFLGMMSTNAHEHSIIDQRTSSAPLAAAMAQPEPGLEVQAPAPATAPTLLPGSSLAEPAPAAAPVAAPAAEATQP